MARRFRKDRLERLIKVLQKVSRNNIRQFNMAMWAGNTDESDNLCGTACCAFGHAALDQEFQEQGLKLFIWKGVGEFSVARVDVTSFADLRGVEISEARIWYRGKSDQEAAATFFGITEDAADYLFMPSSYDDDVPGMTYSLKSTAQIKPSMVIKHVRDVIANKGMSPDEAEAKKTERRLRVAA